MRVYASLHGAAQCGRSASDFRPPKAGLRQNFLDLGQGVFAHPAQGTLNLAIASWRRLPSLTDRAQQLWAR